MSFGGLLREHRLKANLTQAALADKAGVSTRSLQDLERGSSRPHSDTLLRLIAALGLSAEQRDAFRMLATPGPRRRASERAEAPSQNGQLAIGEWPGLPLQLSTLVGREREVIEVIGLLGTSRLVTLVGSGGVGKTRLAMEVVGSLAADPGRRGVFVDLASMVNPVHVPQAASRALAVREQPGRPLLLGIAEHIGDTRLILVLDNCEHLLDACAELTDSLLRTCAGLTILATSREPLGVAGETTWRVPSLSIPPANALPSVENLLRFESVRLFVDRARAAQRTFNLSEDTAPAVVRVCQGLDGIPLALELAAPWVRVISVQQIAERLGEALRLLSTGGRGAPTRHQTLRAAIEWGYGLLTAVERRFFEHLSVFVGGWTLDAAQALGAGDGIDKSEILDLLRTLVEKSVVLADPCADGAMRYKLLETIRQFGQERLDARGDEEGVRRCHADYFVALGEAAEMHLRGGPYFKSWLDRLEPEQGNLRTALRWCIASGNVELGLQLGGLVWRWWLERGTLAEGRDALDILLKLTDGSARTASRARALNGAGVLAYAQEYFETAEAVLEESRAIWAELGDPLRVGSCLHNLGSVAMERMDYVAAKRLYEDALVLVRGDKVREALILSNLGRLLVVEGDYVLGRDISLRSAEMYRELDDELSAVWSDIQAGWAMLQGGDAQAARASLMQGLAFLRGNGGQPGDILECLEALAAVAGAEGEPERALRLAGAVHHQRRVLGRPASRSDRRLVDPLLRQLRAALDPTIAAIAWAEGEVLSVEDAIAIV